ncbi:hypothetical protein K505DRAFT_377473 [Melanomma pulvis-pyrius CBS 109.77]|uniref:DUF1772-domain-containing protein n=1 Tax=Melanomma pulvis-pyrius CBS 109.77 TaxID=1314802 RepID=A0A6A6X1Z3_9PLEO|nr:hypothetical protein K505DRAFT_377473 [Melanomma pulvis-pyrius CBS 109.77]
MSSLAFIKPTVELLSVSSVLFLSGYQYGTDRVTLPNALEANSMSSEDAVRSWYRAWNVGRVVGPLCVNVPMIGYAILAFLEGWRGPKFAIYGLASGAQVLNVIYTVFAVFKVNDKLLAEYELVNAGKETSGAGKVKAWIKKWKSMDRKRLLLMNLSAVLGVWALWKNLRV